MKEITLSAELVKTEKITIPLIYNHPEDGAYDEEVVIATNLPPHGTVIGCWKKDGKPLGFRMIVNIFYRLDLSVIISRFMAENPSVYDSYDIVSVDWEDLTDEHKELVEAYVFTKYPYLVGKVNDIEDEDEFAIPMIGVDQYYDNGEDEKEIIPVCERDENRAEYFAIIPSLNIKTV